FRSIILLLIVRRRCIEMISNQFNKLSIPFKIAFSFLIVIIVGSILLSLPISQISTSEATYFDHFFTAVSTVCVTGLYTQPVYLTYNLFGQTVCILLMKLGGLGLLTIVASIFLKFKQGIGLDESITLTEALNRVDLTNFQEFLSMIMSFTLI